MGRVEVGDLVIRLKSRDGIILGQRFYRRLYRVMDLSDIHPRGGPTEKNARAKLGDLDGSLAGWDYVWNLDVVLSAKQQEVERLRVALARIAQKLGLNNRVPGNRNPEDYSYQSLCVQAKHDQGWQALAALCIGQIEKLNGGG